MNHTEQIIELLRDWSLPIKELTGEFIAEEIEVGNYYLECSIAATEDGIYTPATHSDPAEFERTDIDVIIRVESVYHGDDLIDVDKDLIIEQLTKTTRNEYL